MRGRTARNLAIGLGAAGSLGGLAAAVNRAVSQTLNGEGNVISVTRLTRGGFVVIVRTTDGGDLAFFTTQPEASNLETGQDLSYNVSLLKPQRNGLLSGTFATS